MQAQTGKFPNPLLWVATTAIMLLSTAGFAALMAWMPSPVGAAVPASPLESATPGAAISASALPARRFEHPRAKCRECASIESIRKTERTGEAVSPFAAAGQAESASREITIRLVDGSIRVITDANAAKWRRGQRVKLIAGLVGPGT